jgi:hypothetical protein
MAHDHGQAGHGHDHTVGANAKMLGPISIWGRSVP